CCTVTAGPIVLRPRASWRGAAVQGARPSDGTTGRGWQRRARFTPASARHRLKKGCDARFGGSGAFLLRPLQKGEKHEHDGTGSARHERSKNQRMAAGFLRVFEVARSRRRLVGASKRLARPA